MYYTPKNTDENGRDLKGRFTQGNKGKPKGATNTTTKELRETITNFLNDKASEVFKIWDELDDKDKATLFLHLSKFVLPKPQAETSSNEEPRIFETPTIKFVNYDEEKTYTPKEARKRLKELEDEY